MQEVVISNLDINRKTSMPGLMQIGNRPLISQMCAEKKERKISDRVGHLVIFFTMTRFPWSDAQKQLAIHRSYLRTWFGLVLS